MNNTKKIISSIFIILILITISSNCFATNALKDFNTEMGTANAADTNVINTKVATIVKTLRNIAAIAAVLIIIVLGIKYMLGSVEEKAEYKKSFVPLIVGIIVVMAALQIATVLFSIAE